MQPFKAKYFERDHPGEQYPRVEPLDAQAVRLFDDGLMPLFKAFDYNHPLPKTDANDKAFHLAEVWKSAGIAPTDNILLSFDAMKSIDRMRRVDVERYFTDVWYPTSDDLYIFDESMSWLMYVHHDGYIYIAHN